MGATYGAKPDTSQLDHVRLLIGDTDCANPLLQDEEIQFFIQEEGATFCAAALAAESIAGKLARNTDYRAGGISKSKSQAFDHYMKLAKRLRARLSEDGLVGFYAGGLSEAEKISDRQNSDLPQPDFTRERFDHPGVNAPFDEDIER